MKPIPTGLLALALVGGGTLAANAEDQRTPATGATPAAPVAQAPGTAPDATEAPATRDWAEIDRNGDGLVSPEEMESWLKQNPGPQAS
jgi:hypothetical protein